VVSSRSRTWICTAPISLVGHSEKTGDAWMAVDSQIGELSAWAYYLSIRCIWSPCGLTWGTPGKE